MAVARTKDDSHTHPHNTMSLCVVAAPIRRTPPRRAFYLVDRKEDDLRRMRAKHQKEHDDCAVLIFNLEREINAAETVAAAIAAHLAKLEARLAAGGDPAALSRLMQKLRTRREDILAAVSATDPKHAINVARHALVLSASRVCMLSALLL